MATAPLKLHKELEKLFGPDDSPTVQSFYIKQLLRLAWSGKTCSEGLRPICWRVLLGIISSTDKSLWKTQLKQQAESYVELKERILPSLDKVKADPLSMLSTGDGQSEEWNSYYKSVELSNFIKGDLDRLYLTGIEEDGYFQTKARRAMLLSILFVWSLQNTSTSYRQGMHEIVGCILFVVECEKAEWEKAVARKEVSVNHSLHGVFTEQTLEAHTYYIFERIMLELQPLYDPVLTRSHGVEAQPFVVQFCTKVQEHYLRILDPDLCSLLEESYVQSQLYGLRWSRLMLGREFLVTHEQLYVLWDYMFACSYDAETNHETSVSDLMDADAPTNIYSVLANSRLLGNLKNKNVNLREKSGADSKFTYVVTPLIGALGDFMLAMLLQIREQLMESDASCVMGYLMHYPEMESVQPVVELADMIRRGVVLQDGGVNHSGALRSAVNETDQPGSNSHRRNSRGSGGGRPPSWLLSSSGINTNNLRGVGKHMSEKFSAVKSAVGSGINALVDTVIEATSEQSHADLQAAAAAGGAADNNKSNKSSSNSSVSSTSAGGGAVNGRRGSHKEPVGDVDPLSGQPLNKSTSSGTSPIPVGVPVEAEDSSSSGLPTSNSTAPPPPLAPLTTGHGTGYGGALAGTNVNSSAGNSSSSGGAKKSSSEDDPFLFSSATSVTPAKQHTSSSTSLFAPTSWFPSTSSSSSSVSKDKKRANRASGGVDLHTLQSNLKELDENLLLGSNTGSGNSAKSSLFGLSTSSMKRTAPTDPAAAKSSSLANNNSVGDRLLELADQLVHPSYKSFAASSREGRELEFEAELRTETVKRLRALADVIAGLSTIVDYDMKFANAKLVTEPPAVSTSVPFVAGALNAKTENNGETVKLLESEKQPGLDDSTLVAAPVDDSVVSEC